MKWINCEKYLYHFYFFCPSNSIFLAVESWQGCYISCRPPDRNSFLVGLPTGIFCYPCQAIGDGYSCRLTDREYYSWRFSLFSCRFLAHRKIPVSGSVTEDVYTLVHADFILVDRKLRKSLGSMERRGMVNRKREKEEAKSNPNSYDNRFIQWNTEIHKQYNNLQNKKDMRRASNRCWDGDPWQRKYFVQNHIVPKRKIQWTN